MEEARTIETAVRRWQRDRDQRDWELIRSWFAGWIGYEASSNTIKGYDREDLEQALSIALLTAVDSWQPGKGSIKTWFGRCASSMLGDIASWEWVYQAKAHEQIWDPTVVEEVIGEGDPGSDVNVLLYDLELIPMSDRQRRVVRGLVHGKEKQDIAKEEGVSGTTISWEVKALQQNTSLREYLIEEKPVK